MHYAFDLPVTVLERQGCIFFIADMYYEITEKILTFLDRTGGSPVTEVEPYIPFNINPTGMQPVLTTTYLLAFPSIMARLLYQFPFDMRN